MPRTKSQPPAPPAPNAIIASAARVTSRTGSIVRSHGPEEWQAEGWRFLDTVGELRFACQWLSNALSRCTLSVKHLEDDDSYADVTEGPAADALDALTGGGASTGQMMAAFGTGLTVPGEAWLFGTPVDRDNPTTSADQWDVLSNQELTLSGTTWEVNRGDGNRVRWADGTNPDAKTPAAVAIRIWRPHPRLYVEADSPVRASLPVLRELEGLTMHIGASIDSRLAGAGLLLVPSELTFQTPNGDDLDAADPTADDFMAALTEAMVTARNDRGSASAVAPVVAKAPGQWLAGVKHITFDTPLSQEALALRAEAIRRLALGMDMPPEVLLGQSDSNHWSAWLISEDAIKVHIEPLLNVVVQALTTEYLWPVLQGNAATLDPTMKRYVVVGDTAELRLRPSRTTEAQALYAVGELSAKSLRAESGFTESDAPEADERANRILRTVAAGTPGPDVVAGALVALGVAITPIPAVGGMPPGAELPSPPPGPPAIESPPNSPPADTGPPPVDQGQAAALLASGELMVLRAMERANNRAHRRSRRTSAIPADQLDACLAGAWDQAQRVAALCGVDADRLTWVCDTYTRTLLASGVAHRPHELAQMLDTHVLSPGPVAVGV